MYTIGETLIGLGGGYLHATFRGSPANLDLVVPTGFQSVAERNAYMGYYSGFLPTGIGQTGSGPSLLSSLATGLETILPAIFGGGARAAAPTVGATGAPVAVGTTVGQTPQSHPVLTTIAKTAGGVAAGAGAVIATGGMVSTALHSVGIGMGGHARYAPAGTKGYHMIKKGPHAGMWTRNRHRNVANIRALRRALSRAHGFERVARKVCHFVKPGGGRGRAVFKRRRRKC